MPTLGPFTLERPLSKGGMASVWGGVHTVSGHPIAVKVLSLEGVDEALFRAAFHSEIRAIAALNHPHIVRILDHGELPESTARESLGRLAAGAPYLVMDQAETTLYHHHESLDWPSLRLRLLELLGALAHAHARGIVHRDVKPSNLLLTTRKGPLVLADFGLTHRHDVAHEESQVATRAGTPSYMAPEQVQGRWREFGPATDLYAVGCVAWALLTGAPPFRREKREDTMAAHLAEPLPLLSPRLEVPPGLEEWLRRLLEKVPGARFQRAADAAWALEQLVEGAGSVEGSPVEESSLSLITAVTHPGEADGLEVLDLEDWPPQAPAPRPLRADWHPDQITETAWLPGAGLDLCRFRGVPLVARDAERARMWALLGEVAETREPRLCLVRGPSGVGKSRLARWLCEWGHETGAAVPLQAFHGAQGGPADGLGPMLRRHLHAEGLEGEALVARVSLAVGSAGAELSWPEARALGALIEGSGTTLPVRFSGTRERYVVLEHLLARLGDRRPVVLWLDDVQWGLDSVGFVEHLVRAEAVDCPVLVVLTVQEEALASSWITREAVEGLAKQAPTLTLGPLDDTAASDLVRQLLALEPALADQVRERSAGNPLFAVQLVRDWAQRGLLVHTDRGFTLRPGARPGLPKPLEALWVDRVEHLLARRSKGERLALEAAAVLGRQVDGDEWWALCTALDRPVPPGLVQALEDQHLAIARPGGGFTFAHGMLQEAILAQASAGGRAESLHGAAADLLQDIAEPETQERRVRHLRLAGRSGEALVPLVEAIEEWARRSETRRMRAQVIEAEGLVDELGRSPSDPLRGRLAMFAARAAMWLQGPKATEEVLDRLSESIEAYGWSGVQADALALRGRIAFHWGDVPAARSLYQQAATLYLLSGDARGASENKINLSQTSKFLGDVEGAHVHAMEALRLAEAVDDPYPLVLALHECATIALRQGQHENCRVLTLRCFELATVHGYRSNQAKSQLQLAEVARDLGDLGTAGPAYAAALKIFLSLERSLDALVARLDLVLVLLAHGKWAAARTQLDLARAQPGVEPETLLMSAVWLGLACCDAAQGRWMDFDGAVFHGTASLASTGFVDADVGGLALLAGELALAGGEPERAVVALTEAERQFAATGPEAKLAAARSLLSGLED